MFLPDRFVRHLPQSASPRSIYGDNCDSCGATYSPTELIDPKSAVSGASPVMKDSEHYFFDLPQFEAWLRRLGARLRRHPGRDGQQDARVVRKRPAAVGHHP